MAAFLDIARRNDVVPPQHRICLVAANHHRLLLRPTHLLHHIPNSGSSKIMKQQTRSLCVGDGPVPRFSEIHSWGSRRIPASTTPTFHLGVDFAVNRIPEEHEIKVRVPGRGYRLRSSAVVWGGLSISNFNFEVGSAPPGCLRAQRREGFRIPEFAA